VKKDVPLGLQNLLETGLQDKYDQGRPRLSASGHMPVQSVSVQVALIGVQCMLLRPGKLARQHNQPAAQSRQDMAWAVNEHQAYKAGSTSGNCAHLADQVGGVCHWAQIQHLLSARPGIQRSPYYDQWHRNLSQGIQSHGAGGDLVNLPLSPVVQWCIS